MNRFKLCYVVFAVIFLLTSNCLFGKPAVNVSDSLAWKIIERKNYTLHYTIDDKNIVENVDNYLQTGIKNVFLFFNQSFLQKFNVYIFPDRDDLDKQWQKDWGDATFRSECWMIASGVAHRLDILSFNAWAKQACDHNANDTIEMRQVIWHELVHVFHGQHNPDHTFSYIEKLDWLVEGVATYVSGQLDEKRVKRVSQLVKENKTPATLDNFWKGAEKYGLSGSIVAFIDKTYGRRKLFDLLKQINKQDALKLLGLTEEQLIANWKKLQ